MTVKTRATTVVNKTIVNVFFKLKPLSKNMNILPNQDFAKFKPNPTFTFRIYDTSSTACGNTLSYSLCNT